MHTINRSAYLLISRTAGRADYAIKRRRWTVTQERLSPEFSEAQPTHVAVEAPATRRSQARVYKPVRNQVEMVMRDLDSVLPKDHLARTVWAVVESLDLSAFYAPIKAVVGEPGHPATDPQVLVALWIYATSQSVGKARQLDRLCREHDAFRWLCGGVPINYHMLSDFRVEYRRALDDLMTKVLAAMMAEGVVSLDRVAQDGMRVRASAGAASFRREGKLKELLAEAESQVKRLSAQVDEPEEAKSEPSQREVAARERAARERQERIEQALKELTEVREAKKTAKDRENVRVSTTDPEARVMKMADGGFRPAFNVELATDTKSQVITGVDVINRGTDADQASPMLEQIEERAEKKPHDYLADGGFATLGEVDRMAATGVNFYAPTRAPRGDSRSQTEPRPGDSPAVAEWRVRMGTDEAKTIYKERAATSECVNAQARCRHALYQFVVRGLEKVTCVVLWMVITHNLLRWIALRG